MGAMCPLESHLLGWLLKPDVVRSTNRLSLCGFVYVCVTFACTYVCLCTCMRACACLSVCLRCMSLSLSLSRYVCAYVCVAASIDSELYDLSRDLPVLFLST